MNSQMKSLAIIIFALTLFLSILEAKRPKSEIIRDLEAVLKRVENFGERVPEVVTPPKVDLLIVDKNEDDLLSSWIDTGASSTIYTKETSVPTATADEDADDIQTHSGWLCGIRGYFGW